MADLDRIERVLDEVHGSVNRLAGRLDEALPQMREDTAEAKEIALAAKRDAREAGGGNRRVATAISAAVSAAISTTWAGLTHFLGGGGN